MKKTSAYPANLLKPVSSFLRGQLKSLKKRRKSIEEEDPFKNVDRISDNAAPDADAEEQFGHARISAIKEQLDRKIIQTRRALSRVKVGKYGLCEKCGKLIDTDRLLIYPEATLCVKCETRKEKK
jgi:DnaK suppressor protein